MGDRVLMQCYSSKDGEFGPVIYAHNTGSEAPHVVRALAARMKDRPYDVPYASARLLQETIGDHHKGNLGFGILSADALLGEGDSHGDAGVVLIDVADNFKCTCLGGYLKIGPDGFPKV